MNVAALIAAWRARGWPLVYVRHDSRHPESTLRVGGPGNAFKPAVSGEPDLLVQASNVLTLRSGDVYATGTPAGVGPVEAGDVIAVEVTGIPFNRRGMRLRQRRKLLRANRPLALGFGIPIFLLLLVPFAAIVVIPAAVAGGTLLTRHLLGLPIDRRPST